MTTTRTTDTTTTLNSGSGGDVMDESLVTQSDGSTTAKRPRVVPGGDDGSLQSFSTNLEGDVAAEVSDGELIELCTRMVYEQKRTNSLLRQLLAKLCGYDDEMEDSFVME